MALHDNTTNKIPAVRLARVKTPDPVPYHSAIPLPNQLFVGMTFRLLLHPACFIPQNKARVSLIDRKVTGMNMGRITYSYRVAITGVADAIELWVPDEMLPYMIGV